MTYLERLAMKATGSAPDVQPRSRSRFEPVKGTGDLSEVAVETELPAARSAYPRYPAASAAHAEGTARDDPRRPTPTAAERVADASVTARAPTRPRDGTRAPADREEDPFRLLAARSPLSTAFAPPPRAAAEETRAAISPSFDPPLAPGRPIGAPRSDFGSTRSPARDRSDARASRSDVEASVRHVHVTIGRVEVRAVAPDPAPRQVSSPQRPVALSLEDYLRKRGQP